MVKKSQFSHSSTEVYEQCPYKYQFRYEQGNKTLEDYSADNPLFLGRAMHAGIEKNADAAIHEYYNLFPVISNDHINEAIKIRAMTKKVKELLGNGNFEFEHKIFTKEFIGFIDLLDYVGKENGTDVYDLYDFKYSNNTDYYLESRQLHIYKAFYEKTTGNKIRKLGLIFIPKVSIKQKSDESIIQFRMRLQDELHKVEPYVRYVDFNADKVKEYEAIVKEILEATTYEKRPSYLCKYCEIKELCEKGENYMVLPSSERREVGKAKRRKIWIYGEPFSGKTTMLDSAPKPLNLNTDGNIEFVTMPYVAIKDVVTVEGRITHRKYAWEVLKETIEELEKKQNDFQTIIIDLLEDTREMCRLYKYNELNIEHESDAGYGKGWDIIKTEYLSVIRRFFNLDYDNLIVVSHEDKSKDITKKNGQNITRIAPNIQEAIANKIAGMVDIVARVVVEDDGSRTLNFKSNEVIFGGGRLKVTGETTIPLTWDALMGVYDNQNAGKQMESRKAQESEPETEAAEQKPVEEKQEEKPEEEAPVRRHRKKRGE